MTKAVPSVLLGTLPGFMVLAHFDEWMMGIIQLSGQFGRSLEDLPEHRCQNENRDKCDCDKQEENEEPHVNCITDMKRISAQFGSMLMSFGVLGTFMNFVFIISKCIYFYD